jgi:hypothetical protein
MLAGQQQLQAGQQGRRRWVIGAVACCVLGAAAVLAGVLSVQVQGSKDAAGTLSTQPLSDNVLDALAQLNAMPTPLAVPAEEALSAPATVTPVAAGAGAGAEGSLTFADPGPVQGSESTLGTIKDLTNSATAPAAGVATAPGPAPAGALTTRGWAAIGSGRNTICYPTNGTEVVQMTTAKSPCTVIVLTRSSREPYNIKDTMNVTSESLLAHHQRAAGDSNE